MKKTLIAIAMAAALTTLTAMRAGAEVDWQLLRTLNIEAAPIDIAVSADGSYVYVLAESGTVLIYRNDGTLEGRLETGKPADRIRVGQKETVLYLQDSTAKTVHIVNLDFIKEIDIEGAPFKGKAGAPVAMVVFSDFQ
jgi:hypothetical protein